MVKRIVRLTEADLHNIIHEVVERYIEDPESLQAELDFKDNFDWSDFEEDFDPYEYDPDAYIDNDPIDLSDGDLYRTGGF